MVLCYRDMTFCTYKKCSKFKECHRALTDEVQKRADDWWGKGKNEAPICVFAEHPDCYSEEKKEE